MKLCYILQHWTAFAVSEVGLALANSLPSSPNGTGLIGNGTALFNLTVVANP